jgi:SAM-dependent methyltransferase
MLTKTKQLLQRYTNRKATFGLDIYQPITIPGFEPSLLYSKRNCFDRLSAISNNLSNISQINNILDIGCNLGFFSINLSEKYNVVGLESNTAFFQDCLTITEKCNKKPIFINTQVDSSNITQYGNFDAVLCLSIIHHFKDKMQFMKNLFQISDIFYIEMDGRNFGQYELSTFFYNPECIAETHDQYGSATKHRKTFFCDKREYKSLKNSNLIFGRGIFSNKKIVHKREDITLKTSHTWLHSGITHEHKIYQKLTNKPGILPFKYSEDNNFRTLSTPYIPHNADLLTKKGVLDILNMLKIENLLIADISKDMFLVDASTGNHFIVDLESIYHTDECDSFFKNENKRLYRTHQDMEKKVMNLLFNL